MPTRKIPNIFHFIFGLHPKPQPFHLVHYLCLESCTQLYAPETIYLYYHREPTGPYWQMVKERLTLVQVGMVPEVSAHSYRNKVIEDHFVYAHHSDFIRIAELNKRGGVYADLDTIFVQKMPHELFTKSFVLGEESTPHDRAHNNFYDSLCNAVILAEANSAFGKRYAEAMSAAFDGTWSKHSCILAGDLSHQFPEEIHREPARSFYKFLWTKAGINALLHECDRDFTGVYSLHLWAHLWWSEDRVDFTTCHAGILTEDYIATVDTTYNVAARRFLPRNGRKR